MNRSDVGSYKMAKVPKIDWARRGRHSRRGKGSDYKSGEMEYDSLMRSFSPSSIFITQIRTRSSLGAVFLAEW